MRKTSFTTKINKNVLSYPDTTIVLQSSSPNHGEFIAHGNPSDGIDIDREKARALFEQSKTDEAEKLLLLYTDTNFEKHEQFLAFYHLGLYTRQYTSDFRKALFYLEKAIELIKQPAWVESFQKQWLSILMMESGRNLARLNQLGEARAAYQYALSIDENNYDAHISYGILLQNLDDFELAKKHYLTAEGINPGRAAAYVNLSSLYLNRYRLNENNNEQDIQEALKFIKCALVINPDNITALQNQIICFQYLRRVETAKELLIWLLNKFPNDANQLIFSGIYYLIEKDIPEAKKHLTAALDTIPNSKEAKFHLALCYYFEKNYNDAETYYLDILKLDSQYLPACLNLIAVSIRIRKFEQALDYIDKVLSMTQNASLTNPIFMEIGLIMIAYGFYDLAINAYQTAITLPLNKNFLYQSYVALGHLHFEIKQFSEAKKYYSKANEIYHHHLLNEWIEESEHLENNINTEHSPRLFTSPETKKIDFSSINSLVLDNILFKSLSAKNHNPNIMNNNNEISFLPMMRETLEKVTSKHFALIKSEGKWYKFNNSIKTRKLATGSKYYNFIVQKDGDGDCIIKMGNAGHYHLARGNQVIFAGLIAFDNGEVIKWTNSSGHYKPFNNSEEVSKMSGLPLEKFIPHEAIKSRLKSVLQILSLKHPNVNLPQVVTAVPEFTNGSKMAGKSLFNNL